METGKDTASSLEDWLAMLKKARTQLELLAVLQALPDRQTQDFWWEKAKSRSSFTMEQKMPLKQDLT